MGSVVWLFAALALAGLQALLMQVSWLYLVLKVAGGAYLVYLGYTGSGAAPRQPLATSKVGSRSRAAGAGASWPSGSRRSSAIPRPRSGTPACSPPSCRSTSDLDFLGLPPLIFRSRRAGTRWSSPSLSPHRCRARSISALKLWIDRFAGDGAGPARRQADPRSGARPRLIVVAGLAKSWMIALARSPRVTRWMQGNRATASIARRFVGGADAAQR